MSETPSKSPVGRRLVDRYVLRQLLGEGAHGEVWEADDHLTHRVVAVKLVRHRDVHPARLRREVAVLRTLRLRGVVQLHDEGVESGQPFLVMDRVEGLPFPGVPIPAPWAAISEVALDLLETLARIHAAGVVHRDLKPPNVLVDAAGRVMFLDFGLSVYRSPLMERVTTPIELIGTPAYLAPEQVSGDTLTPRTDLYAVGVMLFEALTGRFPHDASDLQALLRQRLTTRAPRLRDVAPEVPEVVAEVIDQMLELEERDRPRSASEAASRLRGERIAIAPRFPFLGSRAAIDEVVDRVLAGWSVDVTGPHGAGRSRSLHEIAEELGARKRRVVFTVPGRRPFSSLQPLVGSLEDLMERRLADVTLAVEERVRAALGTGLILMVDDADQIDPQSAALIDRCREQLEGDRLTPPARGSIVRVVAPSPATRDAVRVTSLDAPALARLFAGPERILHLPEDAAEVLLARTLGIPGRVVDEVGAWVRGGIARWYGAKLVIDRDGVDYLQAGLLEGTPLPVLDAVDAHEKIPSHLEELLAWISMAGSHADVETLGAAMQQPVWRVEAELEDLVVRGAIAITGGKLGARWLPSLEAYTPGRRRRMHLALARALPAGAPGRLFHLLAGGDEGDAGNAREILREALDVARPLAVREGKLGRATAVLSEALRITRSELDGAAEEVQAALTLWVEIALADVTTRALDRVLYEIVRTEPSTPASDKLERLVRAVLATAEWTDRALAMANEVPPFSDLDLERARQGVRVTAARRCSLEVHERVVADVEAWAKTDRSPETRAMFAGWLGRVRYRQGRYEEAARLQDEAAAGEPWLTGRIAALLNSAAALLESHRLEQTIERARSASDLARGCRHAFFEARAEWLIRCALHRAGRADAPDHEFVDAVARLALPTFESQVCLIEAGIAFHGDDRATARALVDRARGVAKGAAEPYTALLLDSLWVAVDGTLDPAELTELVERAHACTEREIAIQALALLSSARVPGVELERIERLAAETPVASRRNRLELLSVEEAVALAVGARG